MYAPTVVSYVCAPQRSTQTSRGSSLPCAVAERTKAVWGS